MGKSVVRQIEANDEHGFFHAPLVLLQYFGVHVGRWRLLGSIYNVPKIHGSQNHLHFEFPKAKFLSIELIHDSNRFSLKTCHLCLKNAFGCSKFSNKMFFTSMNILDNQISQVKFNSHQRCLTLSYTSSHIFSTSRSLQTFKSYKCLALSHKYVFQHSNQTNQSSMLFLKSND